MPRNDEIGRSAWRRHFRHAQRLTVPLAARQAAGMGSADGVVEKKKLPLIKLAVAAIVLGVAAVLVLRGVDLRALAERGMALMREMGPWVFFAVWALVPG